MQDAPLIGIVDDEDSVNVAVSSLLRALGFRTACFASAEDFLNVAAIATFACVISDIQMPGLNGLDLARRLKREAPGIPVILMSALPFAPIEEQARQCSVSALLSKPFSIEILQHSLDSALRRGA